jgi:hypothetical protein
LDRFKDKTVAFDQTLSKMQALFKEFGMETAKVHSFALSDNAA